MNAGEIATALSDGAMLCAKVARTGHGFVYWLEPSGRRVPSRLGRRLIEAGVVVRVMPGLLPCCPGMQWAAPQGGCPAAAEINRLIEAACQRHDIKVVPR